MISVLAWGGDMVKISISEGKFKIRKIKEVLPSQG
jgi:hypothetical protein